MTLGLLLTLLLVSCATAGSFKSFAPNGKSVVPEEREDCTMLETPECFAQLEQLYSVMQMISDLASRRRNQETNDIINKLKKTISTSVHFFNGLARIDGYYSMDGFVPAIEKFVLENDIQGLMALGIENRPGVISQEFALSNKTANARLTLRFIKEKLHEIEIYIPEKRRDFSKETEKLLLALMKQATKTSL